MENRENISIDNLSTEERLILPSQATSAIAVVKTKQQRDELYRQSLENPQEFWADMASKHLDWFEKWDTVEEYDFDSDRPYVKYFSGGKLNASYNCLDRHLTGSRRNKAALIWQGESSDETRTFTYQQLHREVSRTANMLKNIGVSKGDRVVLYMPMIPELVFSVLACARIGAIHCVVFSGLSAESLSDRIVNSDAHIIITANYGYRSGKFLECKSICDKAMELSPQIRTCVVVERVERETYMVRGRDLWWHDLMVDAALTCEPEPMDAEDPLFILYTSGSTAKPKGILHTTGGYLLHAMMTVKYVFDIKDEDVYWCTADIGWITGHTYLIYGPLANGGTTLMFEGVPTYPQPDRYWEIVEKFGVNIFYTAPTAIRAMMKDGDHWPNNRDLSTLRILGSVGEPITSKAWMWYYNVIGQGRCPIADTWWQTETGGIMIAPLPGAIDMKPGSVTLPFFGIVPKILRNNGSEAGINEGGNLVLTRPWPGMMRGIYGNPSGFKDTYFPHHGYYLTGDGAYQDEDGYFWMLGRVDDVIKVSAHRIGAAEVENALASHDKVVEAAVVGYPHPVKGEGIYAYVTLEEGVDATESLKKELIVHVREKIGPIATPDVIHFTPALPKTRSGKILRRILRKIATWDIDGWNVEDLGDVSTLADSSVVDSLLATRS